MKNQNRKPWPDENGQQYLDWKLKEVFHTWDQKTWDEFLKETVEVPQRESVFQYGHDIEDYSQEEHKKFCQDIGKIKARPFFADALAGLIRSLSQREGIIVKMAFRQEVSHAEIAKSLNLDRSTVYRINKRALSKIKENLNDIVNNFNGGVLCQ